MGHKHTEEYWIDGIDEAPIVPDNKEKRDYSHKSDGWKFYLKIRDRLPEFWDEFNTKTDNKGKPYYRNVKQLSISKFKKKPTEQQLFYWMICPYQEWAHTAYTKKEAKRHAVPWLADWEKRRKNGYWAEDNSYQIKNLNKVIKENIESGQAIKAAAPFLIKEMVMYDKLKNQVLEAFGGKALLDNESPTSKNNVFRFKVFMEMIGKVTGLKIRMIKEWMRINGIDPENPHQMFDMATLAQMSGQIGAQGALSGIAAASVMLQNPGGAPPTLINRDALLLAEHLTTHTKELGIPKEGISVIEGVEVSTKHIQHNKDKPNGKHSTQ